MRQTMLFGLLAVWLLTGGSSCSVSVDGGNGNVSGSGAAAGAGIAVFLVGAGIYCLVETEECFPDWEALQARAKAYQDAQATFTAGLRLHRQGDPAGLEWICLSARQGYANAQFFYGARLYNKEPERRAEAVSWLRRAAAQGHDGADIMVRQVAAAVPTNGAPALVPTDAAPPAYGACLDGREIEAPPPASDQQAAL